MYIYLLKQVLKQSQPLTIVFHIIHSFNHFIPFSLQVLILAFLVLHLLGFMGLAGIKLSAIPAVTLVIAVGIGMEFVVHVCVVSIDVFSRNFFYQMQEKTFS